MSVQDRKFEFTELCGVDVVQPFIVVLKETATGWIGSWEEPNIHASGETWLEAAYMLGDVIVGAFELYSKKANVLSPPLKKSLAVMKEHIRSRLA